MLKQPSLSYLHSQIKPLAKQIKYFTLENGLKVLFYQDKTKPKVLVQLAYDVGSSIERSYERGLAHLVEHMIFKGTKQLAEGDIDAIARKYGAQFNAYTSHDVTSYYFETNKADWPIFLEILSDCMVNSRFDSQHLASELKAVVQELNMYRDNHDAKIAEKALEVAFAPNHPYHFPVIGFKEELAKIQPQELHDFYHRYYHPSKALLLVIGDFDAEQAKDLVTKNFAGIANPSVSFAPSFPAMITEPGNINIKMFEEVEQEKLCFFWRTTGLDAGNEALIDVLLELLGFGPNSRFYRLLVDQTQLARDAVLRADLMHKAGIMLFFVYPSAADSIEQIKKVIIEELHTIIRDGFSKEEVARVKAGLALNFIRHTEDWQGLAQDWISQICVGKQPAELFDYLLLLDKVTAQDLQSFVKKYFLTACLSTITVAALPKDLHKLWLDNQVIIKAQEAEILVNHLRTMPLEEARYVHTLPAPALGTQKFPDIKTSITASGIEVLAYEKPTSYPLTFFKLNFKNSFVLGKSIEGFWVELMMQMLLEDNKKYGKYENLNFLEGLGAHFSLDTDGISLCCLSDTFKDALERILEIFCHPQFTKASLEKIKQILLADILERIENPQKVGIQAFYQHCYPETIYNWSHKDAISFVTNLTVDDLWRCHQKYCNPQAFFVAVSGLFQEKKLFNALDEAFASRQGAELALTPVEGTLAPEELHFDMLRDQVTLLLARPSKMTLYNDDYLPLSILNIILFYSLGSRLYKIREEQGLFYSLFGGFALDATSFSSFDYICTQLNPENVDSAHKEIIQALHNVKDNGITESELADAKQIYLNSLINLFADTPAVTQAVSSLKLFGLDLSYYQKVIARLATLRAADINRVAKDYINPDTFLKITVGKNSK